MSERETERKEASTATEQNGSKVPLSRLSMNGWQLLGKECCDAAGHNINI